MAATPLTQKQRRLLLDIYRNGNCSRNFDEGIASVLEDKGLLQIRDTFRVDLTPEGRKRARILELNEQRRG